MKRLLGILSVSLIVASMAYIVYTIAKFCIYISSLMGNHFASLYPAV